MKHIVKASYGKNAGVFNNAAQDFNHIQFWPWMKKGGGGKKVPGSVLALIDRDLGGFDKFRNDFIEAGKTQFGSGWAWLAIKDGKLAITKTPNGENPLVQGGWPLLGVDVWEHSYYIDYRNERPKYLEAWFDHLINWDACRGDVRARAEIAREFAFDRENFMRSLRAIALELGTTVIALSPPYPRLDRSTASLASSQRCSAAERLRSTSARVFISSLIDGPPLAFGAASWASISARHFASRATSASACETVLRRA